MQKYTAATICLVSALTLTACASKDLSASVEKSTPVSAVSVDANGAKWAPETAHEFYNAQCDMTPSLEGKYPTEPGLYISEIDAETPLYESSELAFPEAPAGIWWNQSGSFDSSTQKTIVTAGHVDFSPGTISQQGGELSPFWGNLHKAEVKECTHIYATDFSHKHHEYVLVSKYTVEQEKLAETTTALTHDGLTMITCSGPTIEEVGKENQFNYKYNLSLEAKEITEKDN